VTHSGLSDTVVVVTGAAQGIGESIATFFARAGAAVMIGDLQAEKARTVAEGLVADGHDVDATALDIRDPGSAGDLVERTVERFGTVDVLVNNAGLDAMPGEPWAVDEAHWRTVIDTDLSGAWWCTRAVLPLMKERGSGRIIFISSGSARIGEPEISVAYNAAKAGLIGLTIGLAAHLEPYGIRVNAVAPGYTGTGTPMSREEIEAYEARYPLGLGGPEPVAHACLYLAGKSGDWVSGSVLNVSGGWWRG